MQAEASERASSSLKVSKMRPKVSFLRLSCLQIGAAIAAFNAELPDRLDADDLTARDRVHWLRIYVEQKDAVAPLDRHDRRLVGIDEETGSRADLPIEAHGRPPHRWVRPDGLLDQDGQPIPVGAMAAVSELLLGKGQIF